MLHKDGEGGKISAMDLYDLIEEKKIKRYFNVKNKIILEDYFYHITQRAPGKEKLFVEDSDYLYFLHLLKDISKTFNIDIHSFALMPNHVHLLIYLNERNLARAMGKLFQRYAIYFNKKYRRKGHVFCGVYRCALCNDENYILAASLYIHLNPLKAGLCMRFNDYRWSSMNLYLRPLRKSFVKNDFVLNILNCDKQKAAKEYRAFLKECEKIEYSPILKNLRGLDKIFKKILDKVTTIFKRQEKYKKSIPNDMQPLETQIEAIKNKKRLVKPSDRKALVYTIEQLKSRGFKVREICDILSISRFKVYRLCNISSPGLNMLHKEGVGA